MPFKDRVFSIVRRIPKGRTMSYREVAAKAGRPRAYRAVGNILNANYDPEIPCHRVIRSDGTVGGWNRGRKLKEKILAKEKR
jgi:O-6-methylguanine DNA methyltransferase